VTAGGRRGVAMGPPGRRSDAIVGPARSPWGSVTVGCHWDGTRSKLRLGVEVSGGSAQTPNQALHLTPAQSGGGR
jgi:hypothetical protein